MIESYACRAQRHDELDLLPWADPYIVQLFADARFERDAAEDEPAARRTRAGIAHDAETVAAADFRRDGWAIRTIRRPASSRRQRIESERLLARC